MAFLCHFTNTMTSTILKNMSEVLTTEIFIQRAIAIHGNAYDYSRTIFNKSSKKLCIICKKHGEFWQLPHNHLAGYGCQKCKGEKSRIKQQYSLENFIILANKKHGNFYDYSKSDYINNKTHMTIICPVHGEFSQIPSSHLAGKGCKKCHYEKLHHIFTNSMEVFLEKAEERYPQKYKYDESKYINSSSLMKIICKKHGEFFQTPSNFLQGHACQKCSHGFPKNEIKIIEFIQSLGIKNIQHRTRKIIAPKELDIYLPEYKLAIEYCGLYWHSEKRIGKFYHRDKYNLCKQQGIKLLTIFEDEWLNKQEIVKSIISSKLNKSKRIFARNLSIKVFLRQEAKTFFDKCHIQGFKDSSIYLGLANKNTGEPQMMLSFSKPRYSKSYEWEIVRMVSDLNTIVVGGASKIIKFFKDKYTPRSIISYADLRYGEGNVYSLLGFSFLGISQPNYFYFKQQPPRYSRIKFQKHKLKSLLSIYDETKSETENMKLNGWDRIFDCGNSIYAVQKIAPA